MTTEATLVLIGFGISFLFLDHLRRKSKKLAKIALTPIMSFLDQAVCEYEYKTDDPGNYIVHGYYKSRHIHCLFSENFQEIVVSCEPQFIPKPFPMLKALSQPAPKIHKDFALTYKNRVQTKLIKPTQHQLFTFEVFEKCFDELIEACKIVETGNYDIT